MIHSPYPRRLERLMVCRYNYKGSTFRVGHLILRALAIRAIDPKNALARTSFHSPKSLPPTHVSFQPF